MMKLNKNVIEYVKKELAHDVTGHDFYHAERVAKRAARLYREETKEAPNAEGEMIVGLASYLHDVIDEKVVEDTKENSRKITELLKEEGLSTPQIDDIFYIMEHMSYSKNLDKKCKLSIAGQCVQDADRLDALGAIGIARAFSYGGSHNRKIYDPTEEKSKNETYESYRNQTSSSVAHFYDKLLGLADTMNTRSGKKLAVKKTEFMTSYLAQFMAEWDGD
ncbi:HD domain-containing protein [Vagococcus sp. PNs007]|uniref:HD domain-containing protein n=1 Tax=Vagococcus proximus TaxID=2991417 RepID=A0ABT5X2I9_9ENTE|nr:HD domain-containing protein [Vagococcus proximus]MDF0480224.1 HD domain-containing protein [Vagococcus proximus]